MFINIENCAAKIKQKEKEQAAATAAGVVQNVHSISY